MTVAPQGGEYSRRTLVALMEDKPGVLSHDSNLVPPPNFNIESLTVGHSEKCPASRA
jgi:acetolactate synthase-1/3 small subunit